MTTLQTRGAPPKPAYRTGWCDPDTDQHRRCRGTYGTTTCSCRCHWPTEVVARLQGTGWPPGAFDQLCAHLAAVYGPHATAEAASDGWLEIRRPVEPS